MYNYHAFGLNLSSEIELPGILEPFDGSKTDICIHRGDVSIPNDFKEPNYLIQKGNVLIWWENIGKVKIKNAKEVIVEAYDEDQIIPFLLGPVMALVLHLRGILVLHGSALKIDQYAAAFLGYRGYGKSNTVINLYKKGYPLLADDILAIKFDEQDKPLVYPGYHHVRLSPESYDNVKDNTEILTPIRTLAGKMFCDASHQFSPKPVYLKRIYMLEKNEENRIYELDSQDNLLDLITHSTANYSFTEKEQAENLMKCAKLINNVTIKGLKIKHSFKEIPQLIKLIEEDFK